MFQRFLRPALSLAILSNIALGAAPSDTPAAGASNTFTDSDYSTHVDRLRASLPDNGQAFTIVLQKPFVVLGDGEPDAVRQDAVRTVQWAVTLLKKDYFTQDPADILDIYLFKDKVSYEKYTVELFDEAPISPYGYYSPHDKALIMNIATGRGTLVHEIVHPFMRANFPDCPAWFNEGLASLYEQSAERDGHIVGKTNWRLAILQKAIAAGAVPSFEKLTATDTQSFYGDDRAANYAQARYLCYYLQEHALLHRYYKAFVANQKTDPTGYETLKQVLNETDMDAFQKSWEKWVLTLTFP